MSPHQIEYDRLCETRDVICAPLSSGKVQTGALAVIAQPISSGNSSSPFGQLPMNSKGEYPMQTSAWDVKAMVSDVAAFDRAKRNATGFTYYTIKPSIIQPPPAGRKQRGCMPAVQSMY